MNATATFQTENASRHLAALCQHFARKTAASHDDHTGHVEFPFGQCTLTADSASLALTATAPDAAGLDTVMEVLTRHLERFAFRENPRLEWQKGKA